MIVPLVMGCGALALARLARGSVVGASDPVIEGPEDTTTSGVRYDATEDPMVAEMLSEDDEAPDTEPAGPAPGRVVISTMALTSLPPEWAGWVLREWSGKPGSSGVPGWSDLAMGMRSGQTGRLLPSLLESWRLAPDSVVVAVGFSAGSNSGLRELLRNADDRAQIAAAVAIDGAHWNVKKISDAPAVADYWDFKGEAGPFAAAAIEAARTGKPFLMTASQVGRPTNQTTMTREAAKTLRAYVESQTGLAPGAAPAPFAGELSGTVKGQTVTKSPVESWAQGGFTVGLYPGNGPNDHIWQADAIGKAALSWLRNRNIA